MAGFRIPVLVLAVIHAFFAGFTALVGAFANGGGVWQRLVVVLLHPLGAAGLLLLLLAPRLAATTILAATAVLAANVAADVGLGAADCRRHGAGRLGARGGVCGGSRHRDRLRRGTAPTRPFDRRVVGPAGSMQPAVEPAIFLGLDFPGRVESIAHHARDRGDRRWHLLKEVAKDVATVALLLIGTAAAVAVMLMMVYVWHYVLAAAVVIVAVMALRRSRS